jgi:hypothetical protein
MLFALLCATLLAQQTNAVERQRDVVTARSAAPLELRVVVAEPVYQPDGGVRVETLTLPNAAASLAYAFSRQSLCDTAVSTSEPADAGAGWRVASHIVSQTSSELVVSIDWRRLWDRGQKLTSGPSGTVQLTLHPGDRIPLDLIPNSTANEKCRAVGLGLEVQVSRATQAAAGTGAAAAMLPAVPLGSAQGGVGAYDADLWLLHAQPSGAEQAQHQVVRLTPSGGTFSFAPVKFTTTTGEISVELTGSFRRFRAPTGVEYIEVSLARVVNGGTAPAGGLSGTTSTLTVLPGAGDVVSFEMLGPSLRVAPGNTAVARSGGGGAGGGGAFGAGGGVAAGAIARSGGSGGGGGSAGTVQGGGARGGGRGGSISSAAAAAQTAVLLEGHTFSLRMRLTAVPGM